MRNVQTNTCECPCSEETLFRWFALVKPEDPDRGIIEPIQNAGTRAEIVHCLGQVEVSSVEDHAEEPAHQTEIPEGEVVRAQWVSGWYRFSDLGHTMLVCHEIEQGE